MCSNRRSSSTSFKTKYVAVNSQLQFATALITNVKFKKSDYSYSIERFGSLLDAYATYTLKFKEVYEFLLGPKLFNTAPFQPPLTYADGGLLNPLPNELRKRLWEALDKNILRNIASEIFYIEVENLFQKAYQQSVATSELLTLWNLE